MKRHPLKLTCVALMATALLWLAPDSSTATQPETQQQGQPAQPVQAEPPAPPADPTPTPTEGMEVITTDSGLKYIDLKTGNGESPKSGAIVTVHYSGWLDDGTLFDSSVKRGTPATFALNRVVAGWTEGVGSMKVGGKRKLVIPPELGYGSRGQGRIPPDATLTFEVELLEIKQPPEPTPTAGLTEQRSEFVLKYWDIVAGTGASPEPGDTVSAHYSYWLPDGTLIDSSLMQDRPVNMPISKLFPGLAEGILSMKVGGKRHLEVPPTLAFGRAGQPPVVPRDTQLIVEIELLGIENRPQGNQTP